MYNVFKKSISLICFFWWFLIISTKVHGFVAGVMFTKSIIGILYLLLLAGIIFVAITFRKWDVLIASVFAILLYIGIVWTTLPFSKLLKDPEWEFVPFIILFLFISYRSLVFGLNLFLFRLFLLLSFLFVL